MSQPTSKFFAMIVGVGQYDSPYLADLPVTVADAHKLDAILKDTRLCGYPTDNVITLTDELATLDNMRDGLAWLAAHATSDSTAIIYFSGHGGRQIEPHSPRTFLCPRGADPLALGETALSGDEFSSALTAISAGRLLVILDACYAGSSAELKAGGMALWKAGLPESYYDVLSRGTGRIAIASSKEDQVSYVRRQGDLSLFTYHLDAALRGGAAVRGDGLIHVLDVFHYVSEAVQRDNPHQVPVLKAHNLDMNFPIALDRGGTKGYGAATTPLVLAEIRERIILDPAAGAKSLSDYLAALSGGAAKRTDVDLKRSELSQVQRELDLFGPSDNNLAARNRIVFFLLRTCLQVAEGSDG